MKADLLKRIYDKLEELFSGKKKPTMSKNAQRRIACTSIELVTEIHRDGKPHNVVRVRESQRYQNRSKYMPGKCVQRVAFA